MERGKRARLFRRRALPAPRHRHSRQRDRSPRPKGLVGERGRGRKLQESRLHVGGSVGRGCCPLVCCQWQDQLLHPRDDVAFAMTEAMAQHLQIISDQRPWPGAAARRGHRLRCAPCGGCLWRSAALRSLRQGPTKVWVSIRMPPRRWCLTRMQSLWRRLKCLQARTHANSKADPTSTTHYPCDG